MKQAIIAFIACALGSLPLAAAPRDDLIFDLNAALKTRDGAALVRCFNFRDADEATRQSFVKMITQILSWSTYHLTTSERKEKGAATFEQEGGRFTLNGDWTYQIHIMRSKSDEQGFVFPAGLTADGKDRILVPVPLRSGG